MREQAPQRAHHVPDASLGIVAQVGQRVGERAVEEQASEPVNGRPRQRHERLLVWFRGQTILHERPHDLGDVSEGALAAVHHLPVRLDVHELRTKHQPEVRRMPDGEEDVRLAGALGGLAGAFGTPSCLGEALLEHAEALLRHRGEDLLAALEVVVGRLVAHPRAPRDLAHAQGRKPLFLDELERGRQHAFPEVGRGRRRRGLQGSHEGTMRRGLDSVNLEI